MIWMLNRKERRGRLHPSFWTPTRHLMKSGSWINSFHHQSVKDLAPNLIATARDVRDGTIEAYESKHGAPILGIQWHPELLLEKSESRLLFNYLVKTL